MVTNMKKSLAGIYEAVCCQRSKIDNRIQKLKPRDVHCIACTNFQVNQLRC
jgi:hypothetical protein